jgi:hypothetical protein
VSGVREKAWELSDVLSGMVNGEPPSGRQWLVERIAWAIHVSNGSGSPRKDWLDMGDPERARLYVAARGAISVYEGRLRESWGDLLWGDSHVCSCDHTEGCPGCSEGFDERCRFESRLRQVVDGEWDSREVPV